MPTDPEVGEKRQVTNNSWRAARPGVLAERPLDGLPSDESKEEEIWLFDRETGARKKLTTHASFKSIDAGRPTRRGSPGRRNNRLFVTTAESGADDGARLQPGRRLQRHGLLAGRQVARLHQARRRPERRRLPVRGRHARRELNVTQNPWNDTQGTITPDGKTVVFISDRNDGVDAAVRRCRSARLTEDPNDPLVRERLRRAHGGAWRRRRRRAGDAGAPARRRRQVAGAAASTSRPPALTTPNVDRIDGARSRSRAATQPVQGYFLSPDGRTIYFRSRDDQGPALFSIAIDGRDRQRLVAGAFAGMTPTADRRRSSSPRTTSSGRWR